jgi:hypothetical protein
MKQHPFGVSAAAASSNNSAASSTAATTTAAAASTAVTSSSRNGNGNTNEGAAFSSLLSHRRQYHCPICNKRINGTVVELNKHIDECLLVGSAVPVSTTVPAVPGFSQGASSSRRSDDGGHRKRAHTSLSSTEDDDFSVEQAFLASLEDGDEGMSFDAFVAAQMQAENRRIHSGWSRHVRDGRLNKQVTGKAVDNRITQFLVRKNNPSK